MEGGEKVKQMKRIFATILIVLVFTLTACGGTSNGDNEKDSQNTENSEIATSKDSEDVEEESTIAEGNALYKVTVVDEGGNPVAGATVQMCLETCIFKQTDANGGAEFELAEAEGYKAEVLALPEGYAEISEEPVYLETGATEITLTVKAVQ